MSKKIRCAIITAALASMFALSAGLAACTIKTDHPQAKITISFNDKTYNVEYKLYRNMYPQTVQHFIELADSGFYKNMIVHDYKDGADWFTGAYSYDSGENSLYAPSTFNEYLLNNYKEDEYYKLFEEKAFTPSVYTKISYKDDKNRTPYLSEENVLPTLIGEFSDNQHIIEKNALSAKFGALKMFYYDKGTSNQQAVTQNWAGQILPQDYKYNCATSVFSMQVGSSNYPASKYCVFAELKDDKARDELEKLIEAIDDYKTDNAGNFTVSGVSATVDVRDTFTNDGGIEVKFTMTSLPIIIENVKITKY